MTSPPSKCYPCVWCCRLGTAWDCWVLHAHECKHLESLQVWASNRYASCKKHTAYELWQHGAVQNSPALSRAGFIAWKRHTTVKALNHWSLYGGNVISHQSDPRPEPQSQVRYHQQGLCVGERHYLAVRAIAFIRYLGNKLDQSQSRIRLQEELNAHEQQFIESSRDKALLNRAQGLLDFWEERINHIDGQSSSPVCAVSSTALDESPRTMVTWCLRSS